MNRKLVDLHDIGVFENLYEDISGNRFGQFGERPHLKIDKAKHIEDQEE